jgi:SNF2 family DNA or RNA helicase
MLRLAGTDRRPKLAWSEHDVMRMERVLGAQADKQSAPYNPGIIRLAKRCGVRLDAKLTAALAMERKLRQFAKELKAHDDAPSKRAIERTAFPHQRAALQFMQAMCATHPAFLVADSPGVGKTLPVLLWASWLKAKRVLIITPNKAKRQWRRAIKRWIGAGERVTILDGTVEEQVAQARAERGWVIAHWESLVHAWEGLLADPWDVVIADEAHHLRNPKAQRTDTAHAFVAPYRAALTAHPFSGSEAELYPILEFLYPERYGSKWRFLEMHVKMRPKPFGGFEFDGARHPKLLRWEIAPFTIRRTKAQVFKNLPPIARVPLELEFSARGRREYERLRKEFFAELDALDGGTKVLPILNDLARLTRLRQYMVDPGLIGAREKPHKYYALAELMSELDAPLVAFTEFRQAVERLGVFLEKRKHKIGYITGGMTDRAVERIQHNFLAGKYHAVLIVAKAGDTALNFGKYGYVANLDIPFNPRDLEQREGRVDRPEEGTGKLVPTTSWMLTMADTYEDRQMERLERRHARFNTVFATHARDFRRLFS